jgi:hypothetical protein
MRLFYAKNYLKPLMTSEIINLPCGHEVELLYKNDECVQQTNCTCPKTKLEPKPLDKAFLILTNMEILNEKSNYRPNQISVSSSSNT